MVPAIFMLCVESDPELGRTLSVLVCLTRSCQMTHDLFISLRAIPPLSMSYLPILYWGCWILIPKWKRVTFSAPVWWELQVNLPIITREPSIPSGLQCVMQYKMECLLMMISMILLWRFGLISIPRGIVGRSSSSRSSSRDVTLLVCHTCFQ